MVVGDDAVGGDVVLTTRRAHVVLSLQQLLANACKSYNGIVETVQFKEYQS